MPFDCLNVVGPQNKMNGRLKKKKWHKLNSTVLPSTLDDISWINNDKMMLKLLKKLKGSKNNRNN